MKSYFTTFSIVLTSLKQEHAISEEVASKLERVLEGIKQRGFKIFSAAKSIDFVLHNIHDYMELRKSESLFMKNNVINDIREAVKEISDMCMDKIKMKRIKFESHFRNFEENYQLNTDFRRL